MKRSLLLLVAATMLMAACTMVNPAASNMINITGANLTSNMKQGEDCATVVLGIGPFGQHPSAIAAAKSANITRTAYVEYQFKDYFVFRQTCVDVYGY